MKRRSVDALQIHAPTPNASPPPACLLPVVFGGVSPAWIGYSWFTCPCTWVHRLLQASGTIGGTFLAKKILVDGTHINLKIWDTAGQVPQRINAFPVRRERAKEREMYSLTPATLTSGTLSFYCADVLPTRGGCSSLLRPGWYGTYTCSSWAAAGRLRVGRARPLDV